MSEITQPPPDVTPQGSNSRVGRLSAASDQNASNKQSTEQQAGKKAAEVEPEKKVSHHDPAVTLASTLSKLDAGSYFQGTISGQDSDGRTIIKSDLGTYLVNVEKAHLDDFKKIQKDELLEIRVITIDKQIKAELIRNSDPDKINHNLAPIPVSLTLTDLTHDQTHAFKGKEAEYPNYQQLENIRSQYNATTLYRAERIAREIGEKLDNLPLPTSAPNYTVYAPTSPQTEELARTSPRQIYSNVFIQEVNTSNNQLQSSATLQNQDLTFHNLLGADLNVEVIKTVPQTAIVLPEGIPDAVKKEISALTPLDNVIKGQKLNINISAIAVPETRSTNLLNPEVTQSKSSHENLQISSHNPDALSQLENKAQTPSINQDILPPQTQDTFNSPPVISGIIVDALQTSLSSDTISLNPAAQSSYVKNIASSGSERKSELGEKNYYLATPSAVLKFKSRTPLLAGTIVSFTVEAEASHSESLLKNKLSDTDLITSRKDLTSEPNAAAIINKATPETSTQTPSSSTPLNAIAPALADKIEQFIPQELIDLSTEWSSISLAMSALSTTASNSMAGIMASRIPNMQTPEQLSSTIFFFLSALKSATPARTWLGSDVSDRLRQLGAAKVMDSINHDFSRIAKLGANIPPGDWRPLLIPAQNGPDFMAIPMIIKHITGEEQKNDNKDNQKGPDEKTNDTRFILEVNFSNFGKVILDGLLKKSRLDIILKSQEVIPYAMKSKLSRKFGDAISHANFEGELVIIDNSPADISIKKMIEKATHDAKIEKKI